MLLISKPDVMAAMGHSGSICCASATCPCVPPVIVGHIVAAQRPPYRAGSAALGFPKSRYPSLWPYPQELIFVGGPMKGKTEHPSGLQSPRESLRLWHIHR